MPYKGVFLWATVTKYNHYIKLALKLKMTLKFTIHLQGHQVQ